MLRLSVVINIEILTFLERKSKPQLTFTFSFTINLENKSTERRAHVANLTTRAVSHEYYMDSESHSENIRDRKKTYRAFLKRKVTMINVIYAAHLHMRLHYAIVTTFIDARNAKASPILRND